MTVTDVIIMSERGKGRADPTELRILLVNDDLDAVTLLRSSLTDRSFRIVGITDNGEHALDLARILEPDIALIKWSMRHFGGALTARLMRWHAPKVIPVLLVGDEDMEEVVDSASTITPTIPSVSRDSHPSALRASLRSIGRAQGSPTHPSVAGRRHDTGRLRIPEAPGPAPPRQLQPVAATDAVSSIGRSHGTR